MACPNCEHHAKFVNWRRKTVVSLFGPIDLQLSYYHCSCCGRSEKPWDDVLRIGGEKLTGAARQVVCLAGVSTSFGDSSDRLLRTLCGLRVSESTVQRTTEKAGRRVKTQLERGEALGPQASWKWRRDAHGRTCAYIGLDHTGVRQQGPGGRRADGKMAAVALICNLDSQFDERKRPPHEVRYLAGFASLDDVGVRLRREANAVGIQEADQVIALSDAGSGLERVLREYFPNAVFILDFYHAKEHLLELAVALHPTDEPGRQTFLDAWLHCLKHEGGRAILATLEELERRGVDAPARDVLRRQITYFRNHSHRMDYPTYLKNGWRIGSGPVESGCKTVVGNRLKGGGMRWSQSGADAVCQLRALYLSSPDCWRQFWQSST